MEISMNVTRRLEVAKSVGGYGTEHRRVGGEGRKGEGGGAVLSKLRSAINLERN